MCDAANNGSCADVNEAVWLGDGAFKTYQYLRTYYPVLSWEMIDSFQEASTSQLANVCEENLSLLAFYARQAKMMRGLVSMLEVGGGPTVYQLISLVPKVKQIFFTDLLPDNLLSVDRWRRNFDDARWTSYIRAALFFETGLLPATEAIANRAFELRAKLESICRYDIVKNRWPGYQPPYRQYDVVSSNFCLESITDNPAVWRDCFITLVGLVVPGGRIFMTALKKAMAYRVGTKLIPAVAIDEENISAMFDETGIVDYEISSRDCGLENHYGGIIYATGRKLGGEYDKHSQRPC